MNFNFLTEKTDETNLLQQTHQYRTERSKRLFWAVATSILTRPLAVIIPWVTVPLFIGYLGKEGYGLYQSIGSLGAWLSLSNAGLGMGLMNRLSDCYISKDQADARKHVSTMVVGLLGISSIMFLLVGMLIPTVSWNLFFPTDDEVLARQVPWAVATTALCIIVSLPLGILQPIYSAYQEIQTLNIWDGLRRLVLLGSCLLIIYTNWRLPGVVLVTAGAGVPISLINTYFLFRNKPWLRPSFKLFDFGLMCSMLKQGMGFFLLQLSVVLLYQTDRMIIGNLLGQEAVTSYAVAAQLFMIIHGMFMLILGPLWPAIGEALRRGDIVWVQKFIRLCSALGILFVILIGVMFVIWRDEIMVYWTRRSDITVSPIIIIGMTLTFAMRIWIDTRATALNSLNIIKPQIVFWSIHAGISICLSVMGIMYIGIEVAAWSALIGGMASSFWGYRWMMRKYVYVMGKEKQF